MQGDINNPLHVTPTTDGTPYSLVTTASTNGALIKAGAGSIYNITLSNVTATATYAKFYDKAIAPTVGTDVPVLTIPVAANTLVNLDLGPMGKRFALGIGIAVTGTIAATGATNAVAGVQIHATYI